MQPHLKVGNGAIITDHLSIINHQLLIDRGYTSHEHFSEVGIIHMNGRLYDPLLRRFLNADENIQDPHNTQNYNKYGYVMNNPLMYNDPIGELLGLILGFIVKHIIAIVIGAYIGFGTYFGSMALSGQQPTFLGALKSVFFGAVSSAATAGIGDIFKMGDVVKALGDGLVLAQAGAHSITQGVLSVLQGNSFLTSAASGFLGSLGASGWQAAAGKFANSAVGTIAFGALSGGVGAELTGGNFWQGAVIGGIVAGLNHVSHLGNRIISPKPKPESNLMKILKGERWDLNGDGILSKAEADYWWLYGKGQDITVDNRLISWKGLPMSSNIPISGRFGIATHDAFISLPYETASTYGGTSFIRTGLYTAEVQSQSYHYKFRLNFNPNDILRDVMNHIGHPKQGGRGNLQYGKDYMIKYKNPTIYFNHEKIRSNDGSSYYYIAR